MPSMERLEGEYAEEAKAISDFKKIILMTAGGAAKMQMDGKLNLKEEQELLMNCADMLIDLFAAESMLLRVKKIKRDAKGANPGDLRHHVENFPARCLSKDW